MTKALVATPPPANLVAALVGTAVMIAGYTALASVFTTQGWWGAILFIGVVFFSPVVVPILMAAYFGLDVLARRVLRLSDRSKATLEGALGAIAPPACFFVQRELQLMQFPHSFRHPVGADVGQALLAGAPIVLGLWAGSMVRWMRRPAPALA